MSYKLLDPVSLNEGDQKIVAWEKEVDLAAPGNGDWLLIPDQVQGLTVTLSFAGGGTGKVQTTTDKLDTVKIGSPVAVDWTLGEVAVTTQDFCLPVTAIRAVQVHAGSMILSVRCQ